MYAVAVNVCERPTVSIGTDCRNFDAFRILAESLQIASRDLTVWLRTLWRVDLS
jgi:hypothetical protein